jgi:hypothetical protein
LNHSFNLIHFFKKKSCFSLGELLLTEDPKNLTPTEDDFDDMRQISIKGRDEEAELSLDQKEIRAAQYFSVACDNNNPLACINAINLFKKHGFFYQSLMARHQLERQRSHALDRHHFSEKQKRINEKMGDRIN